MTRLLQHTTFALPLLLAGALSACGTGSHDPASPAAQEASNPTASFSAPAISADALPQIAHLNSGMAEGALGIYWLVRDPEDPTSATLEFSREAEASQGDIYHLSVRPYMKPDSLQLLGSASNGGFTDYTLRFTHPFGLPENFDPPATASKRLDLFIFDVHLVPLVAGDKPFFNNTLLANVNGVGPVSGYRMVGPLVNIQQLGITDGTNVFPYRLLHRIDPGNPAGNYGTDSWIGNEYLDARGYDVIPQGASADGTLRLANWLPPNIPVIVFAKYMDPRAGANAPEKRANRLPNADPANLRYFLPEASGDLQHIAVQVEGALKDDSSAETSMVTLTVLDWDNAAQVANPFPDNANVNRIAEQSRPTQVEASFPDLRANGVYPSSGISEPKGMINEYVDITLPITNVDRSFVAPAEGTNVMGLVRIRDTQDATDPPALVLDEALIPQGLPPGYEVSTRFQKIAIPITTVRVAPNITAVEPAFGISGTSAEFSVVNDGGVPTSWTWGFGGGATPNTSNAEKPTVTLGNPGTYTCLVRAANSYGSQDFYFQLEVEKATPNITEVTLSTDFALRMCTFTAVNTGEPATTWAWDFGGGATPNTSTAVSPNVRLAKPGTYTGTVTASNEGGSNQYEFQFTTVTKKVGLRLQVIVSGESQPRRLYGMPAQNPWTLTNVQNWMQQWFNVPFRDAGVEIALDQIDLILLNNPTLFNIGNSSEENQLWNLVLTQNPNKLNAFVINQHYAGGLGGVMTDVSCNQNNSGRGCFVISFNDPWDTVVLPHELGHILNLPHVRTSTNPVNSNNYNLMSYGTLSNALSTAAVREGGTSCVLYTGSPPLNQYQVSNDWVHQYM